MTLSPTNPSFTLDDITTSTRDILQMNPEEIVRYRLLHEVLRVPASDPVVSGAKTSALNSGSIRYLEESQLADGSWGRFHSQDTKKKTAFRTTEEAIERAFVLGLEPGEGPLLKAGDYIQNVLQCKAEISDRMEKNDAWPLLIKFILAGRLAQINPANKILGLFWVHMEEVAQQAFASGSYRLEDEAAAFMHLSGIHVSKGFLESQHSLFILSSRRLEVNLDRLIVQWILHKPDGIRYLRAPLDKPNPRLIGYWLRSMNILTRFASWQEAATEHLNRMWAQRDPDGLWDFGSQVVTCVDFPISNNWRKEKTRKIDYSTAMLVLLRKYFD
jgi:hypothetical protein